MRSIKNSKTTEGWSWSKVYYWFTGRSGTRTDYWSCSPVAERIRKWFHVEPKPRATTFDGWDRWKNANRQNIGYWIAEELLDNLQDIWMFVPDTYRNVRRYVRNRYIDKTHYLRTRLEPGEYHEMKTRMICGLFETLVDFVEYEKANMQRWSSDEKIKLPNAEAGINYLKWEIDLENQENGPSRQSETAKEVLALYTWWKETRPARPDDWDASGLSAFYDAQDEGDGFGNMFGDDADTNLQIESGILFDNRVKIEEMYDAEDEEMMIRLIKIRDGLWT